MGKWEFYDEDDSIELNEHDLEPSFSFYDFRKWLSKEKRQPAPMSESSAATSGISESSKEELKEMFKKRVRAKVQKKIEKKLEDRKKES
jgi:hypothetical protein